jgi:hypothetical protein
VFAKPTQADAFAEMLLLNKRDTLHTDEKYGNE